MPRDCELYLEFCYFFAAMNARHALAGTLSVSPVAVLCVSHYDGVVSAGDFYALATVRT